MGRYTIEQYQAKIAKKLNQKLIAVQFFQAISDTKNEMEQRIFERGENKGGFVFDYSPVSKKMRAAKGRQTQFVDFTFTADLKKDFIATPIKKKGVVAELKVSRTLSKQKLSNLNDLFDVVFKPQNSEAEFFQDRFKKLVRVRVLK